ncbi:MAG TPA: hypothetical protein VGY48_15360 [Vicinamibacterales bacterium]|jgi:hypothetical protein|nr:hypothetical protein [Vicinamibacterales bacterium]
MRRVKIMFWFFVARVLGIVTVKTAVWRDAAGTRAVRLIMDASAKPPPPDGPPPAPDGPGTT